MAEPSESRSLKANFDIPDSKSSPESPQDLAGVQWQWDSEDTPGKSTFRDYNPVMNKRIETAYQEGRPFVLVNMRSRGENKDPIEVWFNDMIQITRHNDNNDTADTWCAIRRVGSESFTAIAQRKARELQRVIEHGSFDKKWELFESATDKRLRRLETIDDYSKDIKQFYRKVGFCQKVVRHSMFTLLTSVVVILNTAWLGIDAHYNEAASLYSADWSFAAVENMFCIFFVAELSVRIGAYEKKATCLRDGWIIFDVTLLLLNIIEIWMIPLYLAILNNDADSDAGRGGWAILRCARMMKVLRLGRLAKIMGMIPELMSMCKAIFIAMRAVFFTVLLLATVIYVFAIIFVTQMRDQASITEELPNFKSMPGSMWVLLIEGVLLDGPSSSLKVFVKHSYVMTTLFLLFISLSAFTVLNMLIGILCQVVDKETKMERDAADKRYLNSTLLELLKLHDEDSDQKIRKNEFDMLMRNPVTKNVLTRFDVDASDLLSMKDNLFDSQDAALAQAEEIDSSCSLPHESLDATETFKAQKQPVLSHQEFLRVVMRLRGSNASTVKDIVDLREFVKTSLDTHREYMGQLLRNIGNMEQEILDSQENQCVSLASDAKTMPQMEGRRTFKGKNRTNPANDGAQTRYLLPGEGYKVDSPAMRDSALEKYKQAEVTQVSDAFASSNGGNSASVSENGKLRAGNWGKGKKAVKKSKRSYQGLDGEDADVPSPS